MFRKFRQFGSRAVFVSGLALVASSAHAEGLADLAGGINSADILAGLAAVALVIAGVLASRMGIRKVLSMIK